MLTNPLLVKALEECTALENVDNFNCLVFRVLRCLNLIMGAAEYHDGVRGLYNILGRCFHVTSGNMKFAVGASLLCALDMQTTFSQVSERDMHNVLRTLSRLHTESPHSMLIQFLIRLVKLCRELGLLEVSKLLSEQREIITSGVLLL